MNLTFLKLHADRAAVGAALRLEFALKYFHGDELPLSAVGRLDANGIRFAALHEYQWMPGDFPLRAQSGTRSFEEQTRSFWMVADVGREQIDFLETLRDRDPRKTLKLSAKITIRKLQTSVKIRGEGTDDLLQEQNQRIVSCATESLAADVHVLSSNWLHDLAPVFGLGTFTVFEIPDPSSFAGAAGELGEHITAALAAAQRARAKLIAGEWEETIEELRGVWELFKRKDRAVVQDLTKLLSADGYDEEAAQAFVEAIQGQFTLASKFQHIVDKEGKKLRAPIKPSKEDAYLVYATALSTLNLLARKMRRLG